MAIKRSLNKIQQEGEHLRTEVGERTVGYILAALSLVAGLAWNEAIKAFVESLFPLRADTVQVKFLYAVLVTLSVVFVSIYLAKLFKKEEQPKK